MDPEVVAALEEAVKADPSNIAVRNHLAGLLVVNGDPARALEHAQAVLADVPDDVHALTTAREAAEVLGDEDRAASYGRLLGVEDKPVGAAGDEPRKVRADRMPSDADATHDLEDDEPDDLVGAERPKMTLADVGGLEQVKAKLHAAFLAPLRNPELRAYYGKSLRGGLLLYGPPGCGKTFLARAIAGELGAAFFSLGISDVLDLFLGESERRLHDAFAAARRAAPCVLFLDEIDALGQKRSHLRGSAGRNVVNQLLAELDGADADNEGVFVLAATNHPWDVDTALRRPGRLDRTVLVLPPDQPARRAILESELKRRPVEGVNVDKLADQTGGLSGADLVHLVELASEEALQRSLRSEKMEPITARVVDQARRQVRPSTKAWFGVAHNYAIYANEAGEYDDLLAYIREHRLL